MDWVKIREKSYSNIIKQACEYKKNEPFLSASEIGEMMNLNRNTVRRYLKIGAKYGWCIYDAGIERNRAHEKVVMNNKDKLSYSIEMMTANGEIIEVYKSAETIELNSLKTFGVFLRKDGIKGACREHKIYKGYLFRYVKS